MPVLTDHSLLPLLRSLDTLLTYALTQAQETYRVDVTTAPYRGLYINREDIDRALTTEPGQPPFQIAHTPIQQQLEIAIAQSPALAHLQQLFNLSTFDLSVIVIALAPEIDLRYEQIYAFLQDDVNRKRPTVELALNLLCHNPSSKLTHRIHLAADAPLIYHGILHLIPDPNHPHSPFLAHTLNLDTQITRFLIDVPGLDPRSQPFSKLQHPDTPINQLPIDPEIQQTLLQLLQQTQQTLRLYLHGLNGIGKQRTAAAIAHHLQRPLLITDLASLQTHSENPPAIVRLLCREALCQNALLYLSRTDDFLTATPTSTAQHLLEILAAYPIPIIFAGQHADVATQMGAIHPISIQLSLPNFAQRRTYWETALKTQQIALEPESLTLLSDRFRLTPAQIDRAIASVGQPHAEPPSLKTLLAAARQQSGQALGTMARKVSPKYTWDDLILPPDPFSQLQEVCAQMQYRAVVYDQWGFDRKRV
jgi:hypothetical protein